ncbi:integrase core domain-containing protein [Corynebacterium pseudodiphtheriticum]|nr:integrase core domain-containing protein [Corynebacterium pseudodiphtheriticum]MDK8552684.1 integrase core domain-containing protein [Corynebacterium pseudodiphtheriticum]
MVVDYQSCRPKRAGYQVSTKQGSGPQGITASTGTVGDSYDNALAENVNGSYKNELIHTRRWGDVVEVEIKPFEWVHWWNQERLHQSLGYRTPAEVK